MTSNATHCVHLKAARGWKRYGALGRIVSEEALSRVTHFNKSNKTWQKKREKSAKESELQRKRGERVAGPYQVSWEERDFEKSALAELTLLCFLKSSFLSFSLKYS